MTLELIRDFIKNKDATVNDLVLKLDDTCALRVLLYTAPDTGLLSRQAGRQPPSSAVFTCIGALGTPPPQPNGAPRKKVFTGFPLQLIFAKVKAEN